MRLLPEACYFSDQHAAYVDGVLQQTILSYGGRLAGLAVFGSYARHEQRRTSDLDLLVIVRDLAPNRRARLNEFWERVEEPLEPLGMALFEESRIDCVPSPYLCEPDEATFFQPIYLDFVDAHIVVLDREGVIAKILTAVLNLRKVYHARRDPAGTHWVWTMDTYLGGIRLEDTRRPDSLVFREGEDTHHDT